MKLHVVGLALAILPSIGIAQETAGTIRRVVRNETGRPVEYALVTLDPESTNRQARTDRDGRFSFLGVTPGARLVRVTFVGYRPNDRSVQVTTGVVDIEVVIERIAATLAGVE